MKKEISLLRIVATIAVVFLHSCNSMTANSEKFGLSETQYAFFSICTTLMMWAVPIFFMITGELMLSSNREYTFSYIIKNNVRRMMLALIFFGVPFSLMEIVSNSKTIKPIFLLKAVQNVIEGRSWEHLWYLYTMVGIYLMVPLLKKALDNLSSKEVLCFINVLFVFNIIFPYINLLTRSTIYFSIPLVGYSVLYMLLGKYISELNEHYKFKIR